MASNIAEDSSQTPWFARPFVVLGALAVVLVGATLALWAHVGTTVFYEMIVAGIAACL